MSIKEKPMILKLKEELTDCRVIQLDRKVKAAKKEIGDKNEKGNYKTE